MNISRYDLCDECRDYRYIMSDGSLCSNTMGELFDIAATHPLPIGYVMVKGAFLNMEEQGGGCPACIRFLNQITS